MNDTSARILLSGASGLIGSALVRMWAADQIHPTTLVRRKASSENEISWDLASDSPVSDPSRLENYDAVIHLAGANVASHRWTKKYKREIFDSRVLSTRKLVSLLKTRKHPPKVLLCASATGIYGDRGDELLRDNSPPGSGFLAETCKAWEAAADEARQAGIRVVHPRFGVVLTAEGGALPKMLPPFRMGLGGKLGSGRQWMSWITLRDLTRAITYLMENQSISGPVNMTAPKPVTNEEFTRALGQALHRPAIFTVPAFALRLGLGEMADEGLLASVRVVPERLNSSGFTFQDPEIGPALRSIL
jgi:uncharacterized protein